MKANDYGRPFRGGDLTTFLAGHADIGIGLILLGVLALLVFPVPVAMVDVAIAMNMAFAILLLAAALYIGTPLELATFPSLLLMTTLFRLGLAVATTKMILLHGYAGDVVQTFGHLVVGGNVVVGLVVFAVLCVVQFMVVAKGSDRIAEVSARFTLDAIPGKQMSIDADLRAGTISGAEAAERRATLQREIHMHGALDGAMKFVKGDAIVGLVVALVNIVGGIVIGMVSRGMTLAEAGRTYVVLTVGDGLVSQIPSLIVAIAAGLLITRGDGRPGRGDNLGARIFAELTARSKPALMASVATLLLALVPGFPHVVFLVLSAVFMLVGVGLRKRDEGAVPPVATPMRHMTRAGASYTMHILDNVEMGTASPLAIRIGEEAFASLQPAPFDEALGRVRERLMESLGLPFPGVSMKGDRALEPETYRIEVESEAVAEGSLYRGRLFVPSSESAGDDAWEAHVPGIGDGAWLAGADAAPLRKQGVAVHAPGDVLAEHLLAVCTAHAPTFMGTQEARHLLDRLQILFPDLVDGFSQSTTPTDFAAVLKALLAERVSVRNVRAIVEAIVKLAPDERRHDLMVRAARIALGRQIARAFAEPSSGILAIATLDDECTRFLAEALLLVDGRTPRLALDREQLDRAERTFRAAARSLPKHAVVLTSASLREHVADLLRGVACDAPVMATSEVPFADVEIRNVGHVELLP
ncbi:FHIPEP family type III secretion protein [Luteibacter sp. CQ10]|uniref:FHIPEP family type III secretion protein n=1 Tax=Luteibacter sp. CQ10 TaxID=2805821 RepID=UPI0034A39853